MKLLGAEIKKGGKVLRQEKILIATGTALLITLTLIVIYSFFFLKNEVFPAISPNSNNDTSTEIHFNLNGFEELGL